MGNCVSSCFVSNINETNRNLASEEAIFMFPAPIPTWPPGVEGFGSGTIDLGGLHVCQITSFTKIWATYEGGPNNVGATFYEPSSIPSGYFMLGCYSQSNNTPLFGWVLAGKDNTAGDSSDGGTLATPTDYTLSWTSESLKIKQSGNAYIWLPTPPNGYKAVGHVITTSSEKPSLDKIRCVRSDLTVESDLGDWIWGLKNEIDENGFNVHELRPRTRGTQAQGACVGTFLAQNNSNTSTLLVPLACLKNNNHTNLSHMPNLNQIEALFQLYSPIIYCHPKETYLPSSVNWFFTNGVLLYKKGDESNPVRVEYDGSNLPQGDTNDGEFWLDLPTDPHAKEQVKKGDLQSSKVYLHIKPMLGATFTDIVIWVFYPFNGPATAKLGLVDVPLGKIGEHVGDWEHITLRISNFNGVMYKVYFSEHSSGTWVKSSSLKFLNVTNKFVAYSSLHGHAFYSKPGLVMQGNDLIGIRNDTDKSDIVMDTGEKYLIVASENMEEIIEPPWLNYYRKWGPNIRYELGIELQKIEEKLPGELKPAFENLVSLIPNEVVGEDGPVGPKMKSNWRGDEI